MKQIHFLHINYILKIIETNPFLDLQILSSCGILSVEQIKTTLTIGEVKMIFSTIVKEFKKHDIETTVFKNIYNFAEFKGVVTNSNGKKFDVEGSFEYYNDKKELIYSISVFDIEKDVEVLNDCGRYVNIETETDVKEKVDEILCCDFEECK